MRSEHSLEQHMDDTERWPPEHECETCDQPFYNEEDAEQHMNAYNHWAPTFQCFYTQESAEQHMRALDHKKEKSLVRNLRPHISRPSARGKVYEQPGVLEENISLQILQ